MGKTTVFYIISIGQNEVFIFADNISVPIPQKTFKDDICGVLFVSYSFSTSANEMFTIHVPLDGDYTCQRNAYNFICYFSIGRKSINAEFTFRIEDFNNVFLYQSNCTNPHTMCGQDTVRLLRLKSLSLSGVLLSHFISEQRGTLLQLMV